MGRRLFLHIGTMKSATSYIGQLCELNVEYLRAHHLYWPTEGLRFDAIHEFFDRENAPAHMAGSWRRLLREIRQAPGDALLVNEMLAAFPPQRATRLVRALHAEDLQVIVTARDPARVIPSHWQTTLKNGRTQPWREFAAEVCSDQASETHDWFWRRHDLAAILGTWTEVVGADRITLVTIPTSRTDPDELARRFGGVVGVDLTGLEQPEWTNPSMGAHSCELFRQLNLSMTDLTRDEQMFGARGALGYALATGPARQEPGYGLTQAQQDAVRARAARTTEQIRRSGVRVVGDLTDLMPDEHPADGLIDPADSSRDELFAAAMAGIEGMVRFHAKKQVEKREVDLELRELQRQITRLRARVRAGARRAPAAQTGRVARRARSVAGGLRRRARSWRGRGPFSRS